MKKILTKILIIFLFVLIAQPSFAQLLMEKSRVEETVDPGDTIVDSIMLHNTSDYPMQLSIYWEDFEYLEPFDGQKKFVPAKTGAYSMADWISYSPQEVLIPPKDKRPINYTIKVPQSNSGGHYGVLFFESGSREKRDVTGVNIVTRLGALFFIEASDKDKRSQIKAIELNDNQIRGVFVNYGNIILFPKGIYYIMDQEGLVSERGEMDKIYLPPENEATFSVDFPDTLAAGQYTAVLTFDLKEGDSIVKEVDFRKNEDLSFEIIAMRD